MSNEKFGAYIAVVFFLMMILIFVSRVFQKESLERLLGLGVVVLVIPLVYLFVVAVMTQKPLLYLIQAGLLVVFLIVELLLDYIFQVNFREVKWMLIAYVTLFFSASGGMIGLAAAGGRAYGISGIVLFFVMAILAFVQRALTGY